jgi:hypothetical protein
MTRHQSPRYHARQGNSSLDLIHSAINFAIPQTPQ